MAPFVCGDSGSLRDLEFVLWEVSLSVLMQLRHCKQRALGEWTVPAAAAVAPTVENAFARIANAPPVQF